MDEQSLFNALKGSQVGDALVKYLRKLENEIFDARNWEEGMTRETALLAAKPIRTLINRVTIIAERKDSDVNACE